MRYFLLLFLLNFTVLYSVKAQDGAVLVINGGFINIENGANLVIDNPIDTAIKRTILGGHIISEHEDDVVKWNVGAYVGDYNVPFGVGTTDYLPLSFSTFGAVGNSGYMELATYGGGTWLNTSYMPVGITNFTGFGAPDNSAYVMDRFWKVKSRDYAAANASRPNFTYFSLSYRDIEHSRVGNTIRENEVFIQRYNPILDTWYDFIPGGGTVVVDVVNNTVSVPVVPSDETYDWWVIVEKISPLPVELISFDAQVLNEKVVQLDWVTASEYNSDYFIVERSIDGKNWEYVFELEANGFATSESKYQGVDTKPYSGISYYRLKQMDLDGSYKYSAVRNVEIGTADRFATLLFPNPTQNVIHIQFSKNDLRDKILLIYDVQGKVLMEKNILSDFETIDVSRFVQGSYIIRVIGKQNDSETFKFVKL